jgi:CHAT domain-containing protein
VIAARSDALRATEAIITRRFPSSAELIRPRPVTIGEVRKVLARDETLLMPLVDDAGTILWVITVDGVDKVLLPLTTSELGVLVQNVRRGVDLGSVPEGQLLPAFDVPAAETSFADLIAPAKAAMGSRTSLVFIPDGALQTLPLHLLITGNEWLASRFAVTVEPSAGALLAARTAPALARTRSGFLGVGNPELATAATADQMRTNERSATLRDAIAGLRALPETETELTRMASLFGQDRSRLLLGIAASKPAVLTAMSEPYQAIAFATHAVMAGDLPHVSEPAIVLSRGSGPAEDMLLTASEIAASHMDAELVILSACNTASTDGGPFAEGLSGLARAFFHAGSRTLLVSN